MMNMNKEYRAELKVLRKAKKKIERDMSAATKTASKQVQAIYTALGRGAKRCQKEVARIERRESILQGRLS